MGLRRIPNAAKLETNYKRSLKMHSQFKIGHTLKYSFNGNSTRSNENLNSNEIP